MENYSSFSYNGFAVESLVSSLHYSRTQEDYSIFLQTGDFLLSHDLKLIL